jgi:high-affinity nickel-transport protein
MQDEAMFSMPGDWVTLCATVFALGLRHGLDADHLASIDGMTRFNHGARPALARWCGALFSAGHGAIVILVATTAGTALAIHALPAWVVRCGEWGSVGVLLALGVVNLAQLMRAPASGPMAPVGVQGKLLSRLTRTANPLGIAAVGGLFALSFDTISQALLFSATAVRFQGWKSALVLGGLFTLGMLLLDGVNGAWLARLLDRADETARTIARVLGTLVAVLSLLVGWSGAVRLLVPHLQTVIDAQTIFLSFGLIAALAIVGGILSSRRSRVDVAVALRARLLDFNRDRPELAMPDATLGDH